MLKKSTQTHTTSYIEWRQATKLISSLINDGDGKYALIVALGIYTGLRISDILSLRWDEIVGYDSFKVREIKTGKIRTIHVHKDLKEIIDAVRPRIVTNNYIFTYKDEDVHIDYHGVNKKLKKLFKKYKVTTNGNISSHMLRKTFGHRVFETNGESDRALIMLSKIFNHSSTEMTRRYIGIEQEDINNIYISL